MHFMLIYDVAPDYMERRAAFREAHLALAWKSVEAGDLLLGGALEEPTEQAFLLFQGDSPDAAMRFAQSDPYVLNDVVVRWRVKKWNTVVGPGAATPIRPAPRP